jgi:hypothetical protein
MSEMASKLLDMFSAHLQAAGALFLLWLLMKITDRSLVSTVREIIGELSALGKISPKGINVLGGILLFALTIFLFFSGLAHIILPDLKHPHGTSDVTRAIYVSVMAFFGAYFLICIALTKSYR